MDKRHAWAETQVTGLARQCPAALKLARLLSPAVRLESALIRAMRLVLLPGNGAWIEAVLWFSPLVKSRNAASIMFEPAVVDYLRAELTRDWLDPELRSQLSTARMLMTDMHANLSPALALEERVAWAAITGDLDEINDEIASAVKALLESHRPGLAAWAGQALPRLPDSAFRTDAGQALRTIALQMGSGLTGSREASVSVPANPAQVLGELPSVRMGVARRGPVLALGASTPPAPHFLSLPDTEPRLVDVHWEEDGITKHQRVSLPVGGQSSLTVGSSAVKLRNIRGQVFQAPEFAAWAGSKAHWVELSINDSNSEYIEFLQVEDGVPVNRHLSSAQSHRFNKLFYEPWPANEWQPEAEKSWNEKLRKIVQLVPLPMELLDQIPAHADLQVLLRERSGRFPWEVLFFEAGLSGRLVRRFQDTYSSAPALSNENNNTLVSGLRGENNALFDAITRSLLEGGFHVEGVSENDEGAFLKYFFNGPWRLMHLQTRAGLELPADMNESAMAALPMGGSAFLTPAEFKNLRHLPEMVVIHSNPQPGQSFAANWGQALNSLSVRVVLVNDWPVQDEPARVILNAFYAALLAGSTTSEAILIARLETKHRFPHSTAWAAFQLYGDGDYKLSPPKVVKESVQPESKTAVDPFGLLAIRAMEARYVPEPGLYRLETDPEFKLLPVDASTISEDEPILLLIHPMASNTEGAFSDLWSDTNRTHWDAIRSTYGEHIFCFEHWGLSKSPVENALDLIRMLPHKLKLHILSLSSGGLMGELLCRAQRVDGPPVDEVDLEGFSPQLQPLLQQLGKELSEHVLQIERFIRIACPARGTSYPIRSKQLFGKLARALSFVGGVINNITLNFFEAIADPQRVPGLRAVYPTSPLIRMLNRADVRLQGDLSIVAGTFRPDSLSGKLTARFSELLLDDDNDLMVPTESMYGGVARVHPARFVHYEGGQINHFSYFTQSEVVNTIVERLQSETSGSLWQIVPDAANPAPGLLVIYDTEEQGDDVEECAAFLTPLENQGRIRLKFAADHQLIDDNLQGPLVKALDTAKIAIFLVTSRLLSSSGLEYALLHLLPRVERGECMLLPVALGTVNWSGSQLADYQAISADEFEEPEKGRHDGVWQSLVSMIESRLDQANSQFVE